MTARRAGRLPRRGGGRGPGGRCSHLFRWWYWWRRASRCCSCGRRNAGGNSPRSFAGPRYRKRARPSTPESKRPSRLSTPRSRRSWTGHYSFIGQYAELGLALTGRLEGEIESRLFGELEEGIGLAVDDVGRVMQEEVLTEIERWFGREVAALPPGLRGRPGRALETLLEDARRHFVVSVGPTAVGAALSGVRTSVGVKALTTRLAERLAGGAALRAAGPLLGRTVGFIVAAAAGVGIDIALRKLDELLNRDELEEALTAMVDEEKERVKAVLAGAVEEVKVTALGEFVPSRLR